MILVGKGKKKLKVLLPDNIVVDYREKKSYIDTTLMIRWINVVLAPRARKVAQGKRGLILLDIFAGHINEDIEGRLKKLGFDVLKLPPNTTCYVQPMDLGVNALFKHYVGEKWYSYQNSLDENNLTEAGHFKAPSRELRLQWISYAWQMISEENVQKSFNILCKDLLITEEVKEESQNKSDDVVERSILDQFDQDSDLVSQLSDQEQFKRLLDIKLRKDFDYPTKANEVIKNEAQDFEILLHTERLFDISSIFNKNQ